MMIMMMIMMMFIVFCSVYSARSHALCKRGTALCLSSQGKKETVGRRKKRGEEKRREKRRRRFWCNKFSMNSLLSSFLFLFFFPPFFFFFPPSASPLFFPFSPYFSHSVCHPACLLVESVFASYFVLSHFTFFSLCSASISPVVPSPFLSLDLGFSLPFV